MHTYVHMQNHSFDIRYEKPRTLMVFIHGVFKGEGRALADMASWAGNAASAYGSQSETGSPSGEPTENWPAALTTNLKFHETYHFSSWSWSDMCVACGAGKYSAASGATAESTCSTCPADSSSPAGSDAASDCICNAGFTSDGAGACQACVAGTYKAGSGNEACTSCGAGTFSSAVNGSTLCMDCPRHATSLAGSGYLVDCSCLPGYSGSAEEGCFPCARDTYKFSSGSSSCFSCPSKSHALPGSTSCECKAGYKRRDHTQIHHGCLLRTPSGSTDRTGFR